MTFQTFLLKYGEIGIKGKNRHLFEDALVRQVRYALKDLDGEFEVHKSQARIYVDCEGAYDSDEVIERLQTVFGLVGICPVVRKADQGFEQLKKDVVLVGANTRLELWDSEMWEEYQNGLSDDIMMDGILKYGLNI